jgi:hypothetical protein
MVNLTIVAQRPDSDLLTDEHGTPPEPGGEDNLPIDELMTKLRGRKDQSGHLVRRARTVQDVRNILEKIQKQIQQPLDIVQIIGHGFIGAVQLGDFWFDQWETEPTDKHMVYTLDGDLNRLGILSTDFKTPTRVRLLGCTAGKLGSPPETIEDGPTFVFAFSQLWRTEVTAPQDTFNAGDFDSDTGMFIPADRLVKVAQHVVTIPQRAAADLAPPGDPELVEFLRFISAPKFARVSHDTTKLRPGPITSLSGPRFSPIAFKESFSAAELIFECSWRGATWRSDVIADGTLLRMRSGSTRAHLVPSDDAQAQIRTIMRHLSDAAYRLKFGSTSRSKFQ